MELQYSLAILCEGPSDKEFFDRLIRERSLPNFDILEGKGRDSFSTELKGLRVGTKKTKLNAVLIISDNDNDPAKSFQQVQKQIKSATGYPVPTHPMEVARANDQPTVMVMMLPWTDIPGCLETSLRMVWEKKQGAMKVCVDAFLQCTDAEKWEVQKRDKAAIQCYIAGSNHDDPCKSLRYFLTIKDLPMLPMDAPELDNIAKTLEEFETIVAQL